MATMFPESASVFTTEGERFFIISSARLPGQILRFSRGTNPIYPAENLISYSSRQIVD